MSMLIKMFEMDFPFNLLSLVICRFLLTFESNYKSFSYPMKSQMEISGNFMTSLLLTVVPVESLLCPVCVKPENENVHVNYQVILCYG